MTRFLLRRLAVIVPTLLAVMTLSYAIMRVVPGGPFDAEKPLSPAIRKNIEARFHHDWPMWKQYVHYLAGVATFDFGASYRYEDRTVNEIIAEGLPVSLELAATGLALAVVFGFAAGLVGALYRGKWPDKLVMATALGGLCVPNFVLAPLLVLVFALSLQWLPAARFVGPRHLVLPAIALAATYVAYIARLVRAGLIETVRLDFVRTARAKGLGELHVVGKHAMPLGMLPVVSFLGPASAGLLTGSVVIEKIFNIPGLGRYFVDAAINRDFTLAMGIVIVDASLVMLANLVVDVVYGLLDPRVRQSQVGG
jgi:oligopeptide transport system permease protein